MLQVPPLLAPLETSIPRPWKSPNCEKWPSRRHKQAGYRSGLTLLWGLRTAPPPLRCGPRSSFWTWVT